MRGHSPGALLVGGLSVDRLRRRCRFGLCAVDFQIGCKGQGVCKRGKETPIDFGVLHLAVMMSDVCAHFGLILPMRADDDGDGRIARECDSADQTEERIGLCENKAKVLQGADNRSQDAVRVIGIQNHSRNLLGFDGREIVAQDVLLG